MNFLKKILSLSLVITVLLLAGCSGSDTYRGVWKAMDTDGNKFIIHFDAKIVTIQDSTGKHKSFDYRQQSVEINNRVETYGIAIMHGPDMKLEFPGKDESAGLIWDETGNLIFTISREEYVTYDDVLEMS